MPPITARRETASLPFVQLRVIAAWHQLTRLLGLQTGSSYWAIGRGTYVVAIAQEKKHTHNRGAPLHDTNVKTQQPMSVVFFAFQVGSPSSLFCSMLSCVTMCLVRFAFGRALRSSHLTSPKMGQCGRDFLSRLGLCGDLTRHRSANPTGQTSTGSKKERPFGRQ